MKKYLAQRSLLSEIDTYSKNNSCVEISWYSRNMLWFELRHLTVGQEIVTIASFAASTVTTSFHDAVEKSEFCVEHYDSFQQQNGLNRTLLKRYVNNLFQYELTMILSSFP